MRTSNVTMAPSSDSAMARGRLRRSMRECGSTKIRSPMRRGGSDRLAFNRHDFRQEIGELVANAGKRGGGGRRGDRGAMGACGHNMSAGSFRKADRGRSPRYMRAIIEKDIFSMSGQAGGRNSTIAGGGARFRAWHRGMRETDLVLGGFCRYARSSNCRTRSLPSSRRCSRCRTRRCWTG